MEMWSALDDFFALSISRTILFAINYETTQPVVIAHLYRYTSYSLSHIKPLHICDAYNVHSPSTKTKLHKLFIHLRQHTAPVLFTLRFCSCHRVHRLHHPKPLSAYIYIYTHYTVLWDTQSPYRYFFLLFFYAHRQIELLKSRNINRRPTNKKNNLQTENSHTRIYFYKNNVTIDEEVEWECALLWMLLWCGKAKIPA